MAERERLTPKHYQQAADFLAVTTAHIHAMLDVEAGNAGFDEQGRLKRLYEPHLFSRYTKGKYDQTHPHLSYPEWRPRGYGSLTRQIQLFEEAKKLDSHAAYLACSWGLPQILGKNAQDAGYASAEEMVAAFETYGEPEQLAAFVRIIDEWDLEGALRNNNWAKVAKRYNGKSYQKHDYDGRLKRAFAKWYAAQGNPPLPVTRKRMIAPSQIKTPVVVPTLQPVMTTTIHSPLPGSTAEPLGGEPLEVAGASEAPPAVTAEAPAAVVAVTPAPTPVVSSPETPPVRVFLQSLAAKWEDVKIATGLTFSAVVAYARANTWVIYLAIGVYVAYRIYVHHTKAKLDAKLLDINADPHRHNVTLDKNAR